MRRYLTYPLLLRAARAVLGTVESYTSRGAPRGERTLDPVLFAFLRGAELNVKRQVTVRVAGKNRRIDFRCGGTNPANLEWALRPPEGGGQLKGNANTSEIKKLSRTANARRYLLLVDLTRKTKLYMKVDLESEYDQIGLGRGKYARHSVTVVYVHNDGHFKFIWRP